MKLTTIINSSEIAQAQELLSEIAQCGEKFLVKKVNTENNRSVYWFEKLAFWIDSDRCTNNGNYFWNACGVKKPSGFNDELEITVQIGIEPATAKDRAGKFRKGADGKIYLTHSGRVYRSKILEAYQNRDDIKVVEGKKVIIIGCLNDKSFIEKLASFVHEIARLKK